jgi:hypothetical protein
MFGKICEVVLFSGPTPLSRSGFPPFTYVGWWRGRWATPYILYIYAPWLVGRRLLELITSRAMSHIRMKLAMKFLETIDSRVTSHVRMKFAMKFLETIDSRVTSHVRMNCEDIAIDNTQQSHASF